MIKSTSPDIWSKEISLFKIHIQNPNTESGTVWVSWCVDRPLLELLAKRGVNDPHVLLITAPQGDRYHASKQTRRLVPLKDGMGYVDFRTDGPHRVFAMLVFWWWADIKDTHELFFSQDPFGFWRTNLLTADGSALTFLLNKKYTSGDRNACWGISELPKEQWPDPNDDLTDGWRAVTASLDVDVPAEVFAKPPPAWEAAWVNHWFRNPPIDQCEYRQRRLWAYSIQPPVMLLNWLIRLAITLFALLAGFKQVTWKPILHLLSTSSPDVFESFRNGNYFWPKIWSESRMRFVARAGLPVLTPLSLITISWISYRCAAGFSDSFFLTFIMILASVGIGLQFLALVAVGIKTAAIGMFLSWHYHNMMRPVTIDYLEPETVMFLSCDRLEGASRTLSSIPWRRSVRLLYQATKAAVCRPFAR
ncbi:hypothetical protein HZA87_01530 [Candidatus Uhrbacteria bacterium]|nr:hypothetical protein [Candidatus Uhrbacteria bacterium]